MNNGGEKLRITELKQKEVINITDGIRYGYTYDLEFDKKTGKILNLVVPANSRMLGLFGKEQEYIIPWSEIKQIGDDIILIDANIKSNIID